MKCGPWEREKVEEKEVGGRHKEVKEEEEGKELVSGASDATEWCIGRMSVRRLQGSGMAKLGLSAKCYRVAMAS